MQLQSKTRLGPYEIIERLGSGGMGEVYRARDTRLERSVAIKVLPAALANDPDRRKRLEREARTISALNHPHICTLHDVGRENGVDYLVLEYCDGITLAQRLDRGGLPLELALQYGTEIADALSRAHRAGIIHRDLKPSNIMITRSGIKLLDFGLARQRPAVVSTKNDPTESLEDSLAGTFAYMAPEVLHGSPADARSDIFSLGAVLYEMLTGRPAFAGSSSASVIAAILDREPEPPVQSETPAALAHVIQKCLAKNPDERWESAHDVAEQLRWVRQTPAAFATKRRWPLGALAALLLVALVAAGAWFLRDKATSRERVIRLTVPLPVRQGDDINGPAMTISRDGKTITYVEHRTDGPSQIHIRRMDSFQTVALAGTDGAQHPFFSPDGQWVGFFAGSAIRKILTAGGTAQTVTAALPSAPRGAAWAPDGTIYFSGGYSGGLWRVAATGGQPVKVTEPDPARGENSHRWPQLLPDGRHMLMTVRTDQIRSFDNARIAVLSLETGKWNVVLEGGTYPRFISPDQLIFARDGALYVTTLDVKTMSVSGTPRKVLEDVLTIPISGLAEYAVSDQGDLVYLTGGALKRTTEIMRADRSGRVQLLATLSVPAIRPRASPNGRKIALNVAAANDDIWVYDLDSDVNTRVSSEPGDENTAVWTADGRKLVYNAAGGRLMIKRADGSGQSEELARGVDPRIDSCSPDGKWVAYTDLDPKTGFDIRVVSLGGDRQTRPLLNSSFAEYAGIFSPNGKWIAFCANDPTPQVYVSPADGKGGRWQVSVEGGGSPRWAPDGKELFYRRGENIVAVPLTERGGEIRPGKPQVLFAARSSRGAFDVMGDGFLLARGPHAGDWRPEQINVVLGWSEELRQPARR